MPDDDVVLITGGLGGLGTALGAAFAARGSAVALADRAATGVETQSSGTRVYPMDAADPADVTRTLDAIEADLGPVTTVVANAGVAGGFGLEVGDEIWEASWQVNVMAHVHLARAVVPRMIERGGGRFVSVASAAGLLTNLDNAPYTVTKHAAAAFAEWLAITHGDDGIDVRLVAPMGVDTPMLQAGRGTVAGESVVALGVIDPDEAARRILAGLDSDTFLILTHPEVATFERQRVTDRNRWLDGMRRTQAAIRDAVTQA